MIIKGKVVSGLGKGQIYIPQYLPYFETMLGFTCFPGTLNMKVEELPVLDPTKKISIVPDESEAVDCYLVTINNQFDGAIVIPHKTEHEKNIIELIAPVNLREELKVHDGDEVQCELV